MVDKSIHKGPYKSSPKNEHLIQEYRCRRLKHVFLCVCGSQRSTQKHGDDDQTEGAAGQTVREIQDFSYIFCTIKAILALFFSITAFRDKFSPCIILHLKGIYGRYYCTVL
jgi:hypothetical protein